MTRQLSEVSMQCEVQNGDLLAVASDLAVLLYAEGESLPDVVTALCEPADATGRWKQQTIVYPRGTLSARRLLLIGMG